MQQPRSRTDALSAVPVPMPEIRASLTDQGLVRITHPAVLRPWMKRFIPASMHLPERTLELDAMGTFVWKLMDGTASVGELARRVTEEYACLPAEAEQAVALFVKQLGQRGIIALR